MGCLPGDTLIELERRIGLLAPHRTPRAIIDQLHRTLLPILHSKDYEAEIALAAAEIVTLTPEETAAFIAAEQKRAQQLVQFTGVTLYK